MEDDMHRKLFFLITPVLLFLIYMGCSSGNPSQEGSLTFITYNTGLAQGYVAYYTERLPEVITAVANADADIICLQEVWKDEDVAAVIEATEGNYPYSYRVQTGQEAGAVCSDGEEEDILGCALANCGDVNPDNLSDCVLENCMVEFLLLSDECRSCMISNLGSTLDKIGEACATGADPSGLWSNDGRNGVLFLSRLPFTSTESEVLSSYLVKRVVLHVRVEDDALGTLDVYGTHLTADLRNAPPYAGEADSWEDEQGDQIDAMLAWISRTAGQENPIVLMGDMNCGPEKTDIESEAPDNYQKFETAGWTIPYTVSDDPLCTFCSDNPLVPDTSNDVIIDHIMFKQISENDHNSVERIFDTEFTADTDDGVLDLPVSDHYGVKLTINN